MEYPLISVIVPVYRAEKFLNKCVESIISQTYRNLEILLVDDGSPDCSGTMCDEWAKNDSRIRVIHKKNGGTGTARNCALETAQGDFIAFLDNDDYISPYMYQHLYELMDDKTDIVECNFVETYDDNAVFSKEGQAKWYAPVDAMRCHIQDRVFRQVIWNKLYRREIVGNVRFPAGLTMDDEYFTYRVLANAKGMVHSNWICHAYRQQAESITHKPYSLNRLTGLQAKEERLVFLRKHMPELVSDAQKDLYFACKYAMQLSIAHLSGEDLMQAKRIIRDTVRKIPAPSISKERPLKENIWLLLSRISFEGACYLRKVLFER